MIVAKMLIKGFPVLLASGEIKTSYENWRLSLSKINVIITDTSFGVNMVVLSRDSLYSQRNVTSLINTILAFPNIPQMFLLSRNQQICLNTPLVFLSNMHVLQLSPVPIPLILYILFESGVAHGSSQSRDGSP